MSQPNVLFILTDDQGIWAAGCYGNPEIRTPNLDRMAREGMRFTDAHSSSTVCTPTRYSLMTGRMCFRTGYRGVFTGVGGPCLIEPERMTIAEMLNFSNAELERSVMETEEALATVARRRGFIVATGADPWPNGTVSATYSFTQDLFRQVIYDRPVTPPEGYLGKPVDEDKLVAYAHHIIEHREEKAN